MQLGGAAGRNPIEQEMAGTPARQGGRRPVWRRLCSQAGLPGGRSWLGAAGAVGMQLGGVDARQESDRAETTRTPKRQGK
jgi:hypothetical protein